MGRQGPLTALALVCPRLPPLNLPEETLCLFTNSCSLNLTIFDSKPQGRSPYDDVVQGDGDGGEGESSSTQQYDEKGRPINPETKRLNREIVRSHNEVMHVIGVAEPDPNSNESEVQSARRYLLYEHLIADRMETIANGLSDIAYWTFAGIRHRIMVRELYHLFLFGRGSSPATYRLI